MPDVVCTVPKGLWAGWIAEGDAASTDGTPAPWEGESEYFFRLGGPVPQIEPGQRVYIVAHGKLRGYAPLIELQINHANFALIRGGGAVAVTIDEPIRGFRGWRYVWWKPEDEKAFPDWRTP